MRQDTYFLIESKLTEILWSNVLSTIYECVVRHDEPSSYGVETSTEATIMTDPLSMYRESLINA